MAAAAADPAAAARGAKRKRGTCGSVAREAAAISREAKKGKKGGKKGGFNRWPGSGKGKGGKSASKCDGDLSKRDVAAQKGGKSKSKGKGKGYQDGETLIMICTRKKNKIVEKIRETYKNQILSTIEKWAAAPAKKTQTQKI